MSSPFKLTIRRAQAEDLLALHDLEQESFATDRLTKRRFKHWIYAENGIFLVADVDGKFAGYCLGLLHNGTRLVRLYSIAVSKSAQGRGVGAELLTALEKAAVTRGRLFMRLEVAQDNQAAIKLYAQLGFTVFGIYNDYYEDHRDALRMQKRIRYVSENLTPREVPWYQQNTEFTCGPSALMMAMAALDKSIALSLEMELDIWRQATTIFMTSGHGGSHPVGLALAAQERGFKTKVVVSKDTPLFIDSVRNLKKKRILTAVHEHFLQHAKKSKIPISYRDVTQKNIEQWLHEDKLVVMLISTYRMDNKKTPHWVVITAVDDECFYVHDPDPMEGEQNAFDCQHIPIARADFDKMSMFGANRLRAAVIIEKETPA